MELPEVKPRAFGLPCLCSATQLQFSPTPTLPSCHFIPKIQLSPKLNAKKKLKALQNVYAKGTALCVCTCPMPHQKSVESFGVFHYDYKLIHTLFSYFCAHRLPFPLTSSPSTSMGASPSSPVLCFTTDVPQPISHGLRPIQGGAAPRCVCV